MYNSTKQLYRSFTRKYKLNTASVDDIKRIIESQGYQIIEFDGVVESEDIAKIIDALDLSSIVRTSKAFTYADEDYRFVFVRGDLSEDEKLILLSHEEGHIFCGHIKPGIICGEDVHQEFEASVFSNYIINHSKRITTRLLMVPKKTVLIILLIVVLIIISVGSYIFVTNRALYKPNLYVTKSGEKYHRRECMLIKDKTTISRMTVEQFESGSFSPCKVCLPDDK